MNQGTISGHDLRKYVRAAVLLGVLVFGCVTVSVGYALGSGRLSERLDVQRDADAATIRDLQRKLEAASSTPSDPGTIDYAQDFFAAISAWNTYENKDLGFSIRYPVSWRPMNQEDDPTLVAPGPSDASSEYLELLPTRYWATYLSRSDAGSKDSEVGPVVVQCGLVAGTHGPNTPPEGSSGVDLNSGTKASFYVFDPSRAETFLVSSPRVACSLSKQVTDASPLTKEEDGEGMGIINTFRFL